MKNHRAEILSLQALIESERNANQNQTTSYSKIIKREVVALFHRLQSQSKAARELSIPQPTISRWMRESAISAVAPRKLVLVVPVIQDILPFDALSLRLKVPPM